MTDANLRALAAEGKAMAGELDRISSRHLGDVRQSIGETLDEVKIPHSRVFGSSELGGSAPAAATFSIKAPDGNTYTFKTQKDLDAFKKRAGL
jgi:hypothetical protein